MALDRSALLELLAQLKLTDVTDRIRSATVPLRNLALFKPNLVWIESPRVTERLGPGTVDNSVDSVPNLAFAERKVLNQMRTASI